jgi:hypothetical protein
VSKLKLFPIIIWLVIVSGIIICNGDTNQSQGLFGSYVIQSDPPGADVYIQGKLYGTTPLLFIPDNFITPPWTIVLKKEGYQNGSIIISENVKPKAQKEISYTLIPMQKYGSIHVDAQPDGSLVRLDGNSPIPLPYTFEQVPEGVHTIQVSKAGYKPYVHEKVQVTEGSATSIHAILIPNYERKELVVTSTPPDTEILVDGIYRGKATKDIPLMIGPLNDGQHIITGRIAGYHEKITDVFTRQDRSANIHLELTPVHSVPRSSIIQIRTVPPGSDVFLNGIWVGAVQADGYLVLNDIPPNRYKVTITLENYKDYSTWVFPNPGETVTIEKELEPVLT